MMAHPILLQKKYSRVVSVYAEKAEISLDKALEKFYPSDVY